ncbi:TlpA family protein disulfide reductase [Alkalihalobacterium alkalinitrilicum]|uniref:TlpA family protein disulfide reductase n=1 Tax=Alkalihalobacterium alkalinitrilicum TaxID=427920 RepID=UPI0009957ABC|nr:TlpA disulfide reductase family protein [Alkalihalobacterium alkalinitrilicum]
MKKLSLVIVVMTIGFFIWFGNYQQSVVLKDSPFTLPQVGYTAPTFLLNDFNGQVSELEKYRGAPVLLNFWASWCPPCRVEMPHLISAYEQFSDHIHFVGINMAHQDRHDAALEFISTYDVPYENLIDEHGQVARQYQVTAFPTTVLLDGEGVIVYRRVGGMTEREIISVMNRVLEEGRGN